MQNESLSMKLNPWCRGYRKVLTIGCGTCVAVCLAGGEKEVGVLNKELQLARKMAGSPITLGAHTVERQCDMEFLEELDSMVDEYDALLSMACGAGVQFLVLPNCRFSSNIPVFSGGHHVHRRQP